ncbi:MAG TPA: SDR family NAD(P)-dependent oxidoreductase [Natronosporangium sp.]|nr:SDR family NAD(P)-dependent oxidoreductase [Natronosporangium sp.]
MPTQTVLVTGATGGLGTAVTDAFLADGWRVVAPVRPGGTRLPPAAVETVVADVSDERDVARAAELAAASPDAPLRAVVNLVGGFAAGPPVHQTPLADLEEMLRRNLRPTWLVTAACLPHLVAAGGGAVVCVSARAAVHPFRGAAAYATAKAAVLAFARAVAVEYADANVRCNTVLPGTIDTPANRRAQPDADRSLWTPPEQVARTVRFLAGAESAPVTGAAVPVHRRP